MSGAPHRHFHDELSDLKARVLQMSADAQAALGTALEALLQRDADRATAVIEGDQGIDSAELAIEETVIKLLATQQPMARDLRFLTAAMKIANDLERVGDHAVNIAQSAQQLRQRGAVAPVPELVEISRQSRKMLADALEAFIRGDTEAARAVCRRDDAVDALHRSVFRIVLTHMMEDPRTISAGIEMVLVSRNLERVADLATNIAEDVVFMVEGRSIKHHAQEEG
ncbi:MAG: phosphate signaling complex protein PhoU [Gemmatimonadetes bacterium]|nr:phosphate signaling complex protein PhoU [Gemmatimonadota bacterium]MBI2615731.1 phosphate signaling complex protein PhoU [Gemmatimonadota bacterium]